MVGMSRNGAPLAELLKRDYREAGQRATDALIRGIGLGKGYKAVAQEMEHALDMDFDRSVTIARMEIARAYRQAQMDQYKASNVVSRVIRLCYKPTACFACLMLDGTEVKNWILEDHPRGKCTSIVETKGGIRPTWQTGREWFEQELSPEEQERLIGPGRMELWKSGAFRLPDFVTIKPNETWGGNPGLIPLADLESKSSGIRGFAMGLRGSPHILTDEEIGSLKLDITAIQADESVFIFNQGWKTGYNDDNDTVMVRGDVLPDKNSKAARDLMSPRAVLAHEYYGHRAYRWTKLPPGAWNDEFRASYRAAVKAPGLSDEDRAYLIRDAMDRAEEANIYIKPNGIMRRLLNWGYYE